MHWFVSPVFLCGVLVRADAVDWPRCRFAAPVGIASAIRMTMGPPVFFRQQRPGYRGQPLFDLVKLRFPTTRLPTLLVSLVRHARGRMET